MTVIIVYDSPEEAAAGVLLGYNSIKLAERAPRISRGGVTRGNETKSYFRIDTAPQLPKRKKPQKWGNIFKFV